MLTPLTGLLAALAGFTAYYLGAWWTGAKASTNASTVEARPGGGPTPAHLGIGLVTNFFDTLGIGSFAPTTAIFKFFKMVPDRLIPGTLNVGHTLPTITQAFIYTVAIEVDCEDADSDDHCGGRRRVAGRRNRGGLAQEERSGRHGLRTACGRRRCLPGATSAAAAQTAARSAWRAPGSRSVWPATSRWAR
jgi:hypothetical protein